MSKVIVERDDMVAIADAVRDKTGETAQMNVSEINSAINNISTIGNYVWEKYPFGWTASELTSCSNGSYGSSSTSMTISAGKADIIFYEKINYDEATDSYTGENIVFNYVQTTSKSYPNDSTFLSAEEVPDNAYIIINNKAYKTSADTRYSIYRKQSGSSSYSYYLQFSNVQVMTFGKGAMIGRIVSDNAEAYPINGISGDFYYKRIIPTTKITLKVNYADYLKALFYVSDGIVRKTTTYGTFSVDKNTMYTVHLQKNSSAPNVSGASYKQYSSASTKNSSNTTVYTRVYTFLAEDDVTISC